MIKFFSRTRNRLFSKTLPDLSSGRVRKYLLYSIGEIVLVVIGILIALQINNWNEIQKDKKEESILLTNLKDEFVFNRQELKKAEKSLTYFINNVDNLLKLFGSPKDSVDLYHLDSLLYSSFFSPAAEISQNVFKSIASTGKIDLLRNPKLKTLLLSWESEIINFKIQENNMYQNLNRNVVPRMEERISFQNLEKFGRIKGIQDSKLKPDNRDILNDMVAENIFFNHLWEMHYVSLSYPPIYELLDAIIMELE